MNKEQEELICRAFNDIENALTESQPTYAMVMDDECLEKELREKVGNTSEILLQIIMCRQETPQKEDHYIAYKMIVKSYAVYCDICEKPLGCYYNYKPTPTKLRAEGIKIVINNGKAQTICAKCFNNLSKK